MDQCPTAVVTRVGLQADLPRPEEGAGLFHVPHKSFIYVRRRQISKAQSFNTPEALLLPTLVLCYPGEQTPSCLSGQKYGCVVILTPTLRLDNILIKPVLVICGRKVPENSAGKV